VLRDLGVGSHLFLPVARPGRRVVIAETLDDALVASLREVIYWLPAAAGITGPEAYGDDLALGTAVASCLASSIQEQLHEHRGHRVLPLFLPLDAQSMMRFGRTM
jgi:hypothetical protein